MPPFSSAAPEPTLVGTYLRLRLRLLGRLAREAGWLRLTLVLPMLLLAGLQVVNVLGQHPVGRWALPVLLAGTLLSAHRQRADLPFLATAAPQFAPWLATEYLLLSLPVALGLLALRAYGAAALVPVLAALVAWAPAARADRPQRQRRRSWFRAEAFEWVGGMRATYGWGLWLVLVGLAGWFRAAPLAAGLALVAWLLVVLGHYGTPEPVTMLVLVLRQPGQFLRRRLALGLGYAALTALPFLVLLGSGRLALGVGLYWLGVVALCILAKYAFYPNATHIRITQGLVLAVLVLCLGHPAFPPLVLVAVAGLIWQSQRRLQSFLPAPEHAGSN
jgi:hypothetical protein